MTFSPCQNAPPQDGNRPHKHRSRRTGPPCRTSTKPSGGRGATGARPARFKNHSWCWLCRHSDQKCSEPDSFLRFLYEIELSLQSRAHFVDLILQKCCGPPVFTILCDQPLGDDDGDDDDDDDDDEDVVDI